VNKSFRLQGPDVAGQGAVSVNYNISDQLVTTNTHTEQSSYTVGFSEGWKINLGDIFNVGADSKTTWTWTDSTSTGGSTGNTHQALLTLGSSTVGCGEWIDVYEDTKFNTFLFVPPPWNGCSPPAAPHAPVSGSESTPGIALQGNVSTSTHQPIKGQAVAIAFAHGPVRLVYTDSSGNYIVYSAPAGAVRVSMGPAKGSATIVAGKTAVVNLVVP
jgi:hypothetical protein